MTRVNDTHRPSPPPQPRTDTASGPARRSTSPQTKGAEASAQKNVALNAYSGSSAFDAPVKKSTHTPQEFSAALASSTAQSASTASASAAASPPPLNPESVKAAERDYKNMPRGAATTIGLASLIESHKDDKDYVAALVDKARQGGELDYAVGGLNGAFTTGFPESTKQTLHDGIQIAREKGTITDQQIRDLGTRNAGWQEVARRLGVTDVGHDTSTDGAVNEVKKAQDAYNDAHKEVKELNEQMQKELARFSPALDDKQRASYVAQYKELHAEAYQKETQAAAGLDEALQKNLPALERAAVSDPKARAQLYDSLKAVASSPTPKSAVQFTADLARPENAHLREAFSQYGDFEKEVAQPATSGVVGQLLAENKGDPQSAFAQLQEMLQPVIDAGKNYGAPGWELFKTGTSELKEAWESIEKAAKGDYSKLAELGEKWGELDKGGSLDKMGLAKGLAGAAFALGGAALGAKGGIDELQQGEYVKAIGSFAKAGESGLEVIAGTTQALSGAGKIAEYAQKGLPFAEFATKLAPALGLVANSASFIEHLQDAGKNGGNVGFAVAALGDAIGVMGSAIELIPGAQPVGALFTGIGAGVSAVGEILGNLIQDGKIKDEERKSLRAAGIDDAQIERFINADPSRVRELATDLHLSPAQIQQLDKQYTGLLEGSGRGIQFSQFKGMAQALALNGDETFGLLQAASQGFPDANAALSGFMFRLSQEQPQPRTEQEWRDTIHRIATDPRNAEGLRQLFANVDGYVRNLVRNPSAVS